MIRKLVSANVCLDSSRSAETWLPWLVLMVW